MSSYTKFLLCISFFSCNTSPTVISSVPQSQNAPQTEVDNKRSVLSKPRSVPVTAPIICQANLPEGFVALEQLIPSLQFDIRYATKNNFTQKPLSGYEISGAWLHIEAAKALLEVQNSLQPLGLGLIIYDAYRPVRASQAMVAWTEKTNQEFLLEEGYIASKSKHNHGNTLDLSLVDLKTKIPLDMGTSFDTFSEKSHTENAESTVKENRLLLQKVMKAQGFRPYAKEWWHFSYPMKNTKPLNVPYACKEEKENLLDKRE